MSRALESLPGLSRPSSRAWVGLVLLAAGLLGPAVAAGLRAPASRFVVVYAVAVAGFLLLVSARDALPLRAVVVVAVLARVAFLPVAPTLSDDHYRYLWDGRVQLAGVNPYLYAPEDARLDEVAFEGRDLVNHPDLRTPYPPLAQALFLGLADLDGGVTTLKLVLGVADLLRRRRGLVARRRAAEEEGAAALPRLPVRRHRNLVVGAPRRARRPVRRARRRASGCAGATRRPASRSPRRRSSR